MPGVSGKRSDVSSVLAMTSTFSIRKNLLETVLIQSREGGALLTSATL